jgi:tRNA U34 5-carboxymethylaminomethyl modifying GTPase MnmE/TrmE
MSTQQAAAHAALDNEAGEHALDLFAEELRGAGALSSITGKFTLDDLLAVFFALLYRQIGLWHRWGQGWRGCHS